MNHQTGVLQVIFCMDKGIHLQLDKPLFQLMMDLNSVQDKDVCGF